MKKCVWVLAVQSLAWGQATDDTLRRTEQDMIMAQQAAEQARKQAEVMKELTTDFRQNQFLERAKEDILRLQSTPGLNLQQADELRRLEEQMRLRTLDLQRQAHDLAMMQLPAPAPVPAVAPVPPTPPVWAAGGVKVTDEERLYRQGKSELENREWDDAEEVFRRLADRRGARADASLYWLAYSQNKMGRKSEASSTLATLMRTYPTSRWLDDAKALDLEVKQSSGQPVSPEAEADEDLKILALNGMIHSDPERAMPVLQNLLQKSTSARLKDRALFVLAQSKTPQARELMTRMARGGANPDLQHKAIEYLGYHNTPESKQLLSELYSGSNDALVKRAVLRAYSANKDREKLFAAARSEQNTDLRREAIRGLGHSGADAELWQLYQGEMSPDLKIDILRALPGNKDNLGRLTDLARAEKDSKVRRELIQQIGFLRVPQAAETLTAMYPNESDVEVRRTILDALYSQKNARALVEIARAENDPKLRRTVVERLSRMKSKEASDYLLELLNK